MSGSDNMILIGLAGRAGSGKTTVANYLYDRHRFCPLAFANPIKHALMMMFDMTLHQLDGNTKEETIDWLGRSPRYLMQTLGTEWGREMVHEDLWLMLATRNLQSCKKNWIEVFRCKPFMAVYSDVRFENEAAWIRDRGGVVAHVVRDTGRSSEHASEAGVELIDGDWRIDNDGSLDDLHGLIDSMIASLSALRYYDRAAGV